MPVHNRGTPTCTSTAKANTESTISATAHKCTGNAASPYTPSTKHTAPTNPAMPIPAVKNSKIKSDKPMANNKYATGGLATVCISCPTTPSLKNRAVVASRTTRPVESSDSTTVSSVWPSIVKPSSAYNMLRTTGTPSSVPTFLSTPSLRASLKPTLEFFN
ncbi:unannotated protein [freshwater metagenome]|uniref:Unannotated protein n=1 Tax=freshwater metagenome TaxID=449393 RepID=A0A6J6XDK9_9ZZZZ